MKDGFFWQLGREAAQAVVGIGIMAIVFAAAFIIVVFQDRARSRAYRERIEKLRRGDD